MMCGPCNYKREAIMRRGSTFSLLAAAIIWAISAAPAQAQRDRVFVASYGSDSNPCTFGSPCKTFQNAFNVAAVGGEVTAIDSAGFGPLYITHSITITSPNGVEAGIAAPSGGTAISIAAGSNGVVVFSGLTLEGAGTADYGIYVSDAARVEVDNCAIRNYTYAGIYVGTAVPTSILISDTSVSDVPDSFGIQFIPNTGGSITAALNRVSVNNAYNAVEIGASNGIVETQITHSHLDNNANCSVFASGATASDASYVILQYVSMNQTPVGVSLEGYATAWLSHVVQTTVTGFNSTAGVLLNGANATAYSDNTNHMMGGISGGSFGSWSPQ
jgi:hypothetical protein